MLLDGRSAHLRNEPDPPESRNGLRPQIAAPGKTIAAPEQDRVRWDHPTRQSCSRFEVVTQFECKRQDCHSGADRRSEPGIHEHQFSKDFRILCSWIPGSWATPRPRNDKGYFKLRHYRFAGLNSGSVISSSIFSNATSTGMSRTSASGVCGQSTMLVIIRGPSSSSTTAIA